MYASAGEVNNGAGVTLTVKKLKAAVAFAAEHAPGTAFKSVD